MIPVCTLSVTGSVDRQAELTQPACVASQLSRCWSAFPGRSAAPRLRRDAAGLPGGRRGEGGAGADQAAPPGHRQDPQETLALHPAPAEGGPGPRQAGQATGQRQEGNSQSQPNFAILQLTRPNIPQTDVTKISESNS